MVGTEIQRRLDAATTVGVETGTFETADALLTVADVMPTSIGGRAGTRQNAFNAGMIEWVTREKSIAEVFAAIDAEWEAVRLRGEG